MLLDHTQYQIQKGRCLNLCSRWLLSNQPEGNDHQKKHSIQNQDLLLQVIEVTKPVTRVSGTPTCTVTLMPSTGFGSSGKSFIPKRLR